jgi:PAS domain S-box-containing protein
MAFFKSPKTTNQSERLRDADVLLSIIDKLPSIIFAKDDQLRFVLSNKKHSELAGKTEKELLGFSDEDFFNADVVKGFVERDRAVLETGIASEIEEVVTRPDGTSIPLIARKVRHIAPDGKTYLIGTCFEISETKRREEQLRLLAETVPVGVLQVDGQGRVQFMNKLAGDYFSLSSKPESFSVFLKMLSNVPHGFPAKEVRFEATLKTGQNAARRMLVISSGWQSSPGEAHQVAIVSFVDVSEMMQLRGIAEDRSQQLGTLMDRTRSSIATIGATATSLNGGAATLMSQTDEQISQLDEMTSAIAQLADAVRLNSENSMRANKMSVESSAVAVEGQSLSVGVSEQMGKIKESSRKISSIVDLIQEIAFQTNILALNAAVEAARAGEVGRGFSVVASEVRGLAQRSAESLKAIKSLIDESQHYVKQGSELVDQMKDKLGAITTSTGETARIVSQIAVASQQQAAGVEQVNAAARQVEQAAQANSRLVDQLTSTAMTVDKSISDLADLVANPGDVASAA